MKMLYIYKITNLINGKIYVGKHSHKKTENGYFGSGVAIKKGILKYGKVNFIKEILCICSSEKELNNSEIYWIDKLKSFSNGYNMTKGGEGKLGHVQSEETKNKASKSMIEYYKNNPQTILLLSKKASERTGDKNSFYGRKLTPEHINIMTIARIKAISGKNNPSAVVLKCLENDKIFYTAKDAAEFCKLKYSTTILKAAKGTRKSAGGYTWEIIKNK
jgi:group I intron endonuclease